MFQAFALNVAKIRQKTSKKQKSQLTKTFFRLALNLKNSIYSVCID